MLTKIIFTLAVIIIVALIFRTKTQPARLRHPIDNDKDSGGISARFVAYTLLALVIATSALVFVLHWNEQHRIMNIQVTDSQGQSVTYQAYKKSIDGRRFTTLDDVGVTLGADDRIEILDEKN